MLVKPFAVATAGLAATGAAFLLPPEVSEADIANANIASIDPIVKTEAFSVALECPGCPIQSKDRHGRVKVKTGSPNHLELDFSLDHQADSDRLLVNGFELYPNSDPFHNALTVTQVRDHEDEDAGEHEGETHGRHHNQHKEIVPPELGFSLQIQPAAEDKDGLKLVDLDLQIIEVNNRFVDGVPNIHVKLVKDQANRLAIAAIEKTSSDMAPMAPTPPHDQKECTTMLCKWMAILQDKLPPMKKPCHGKPGPNGHSGQLASHHKFRPGHFGKPRHHSWAQLFKNITSLIILPILIGIVAGVSVSLIGMAVGTLIVSVWRTLFRRHHRSSGHSHKAASREAIVAEEKSSLMDDQGLPAYEDEEAPKTDA